MSTALGEVARSPFARVLLIGGLVLLLQVPSCMIGQLARERQQSRDEATAEIARTWGAGQHLAGPFLAVPYRIRGVNKKGEKIDLETGTVVILPERLEVRSQATVETLRRGLFEVPVYRARLSVSGRFRAPQNEIGSLVPREALLWNEAQLVLRLSDVHAIDRVAPLRWAGAAHEFQGGGGLLCENGLHAPLPAVTAGVPAEFSIELAIRGSEGLYFSPAARETQATLESNWPHPKFGGSWLPERREVGGEGFTAAWAVTSIARGLPSVWKKGTVSEETLNATRFGAEFLYPVDPYRMSERTLKYDLLFVGLTFVAVWLSELLARRPVHPVQYLMLGAALCLFYLLELSLAEHLGFATAYVIAATAVTLQVSLYARSALHGVRPALVLMAAVAGLYALLYLLLREEDYALLVGSGSLFVVLSLVMFLTRRVQWTRSGEALAGQVPS